MEKFSTFCEQKEGTYVGAKFDEESIDKLVKLQKALGIDNPVPSDSFHVTVLYSRNKIDVTPRDYTYKAQSMKLEHWDARDGKTYCVLRLDCPELTARHDELMDQGGTHDFDDYDVHVTLSYDHKSTDVDFDLMELNIINEYVEPLNLDWSPE